MKRVVIALALFFAPLLSASPAQADDVWWAQQNWENDYIAIAAPDGWEFAYVRAWYGAADNSDCGYDVSEQLGQLALGKAELAFYADNSTFGDSCWGVYKVFRFTWGIVPVAVIVEPPVIEPPIVEPPIVEPPIIEPPIVEPPVVEPPIIEPPIVEPPIVVPPIVIPDPPILIPDPPIIVPPITPAELPKPEPVAEPKIFDLDPQDIDPTTLTNEDVVILMAAAYEVLDNAAVDSPAYQQALEQLFVAAQADDIEVDEQLANVPLLGNAAVAVVGAINYIGNIGSDMSHKARAKAKQEVVVAVVAVGAAVQATTMASVAGFRRFR